MDLVDTVLAGTDVLDAINCLEKKCSVRRPSCHRNVLGTWAPIYLSGTKVASSKQSVGESEEIKVPMKVDIFRTTGKKFAAKNHYGLFYASLENGEEITFKGDGMNTIVLADEKNQSVELGTTVGGYVLHYGGITYVSDYLLMQRDAQGLYDVWLRCDEAYLGKNEL